MVHRPSDSRLLTNLLSHEKDYVKHLSSLIDSSHASLASFSAYAAASAPPVSGVILAVAGSFAGADDALTKYTTSVEEWRAHLVELKELEDEVGNVMRDREIYVNRLIKASKSQKPTRESLLISQPLSSGSTVSLKSEYSATGKLSAAQAELQACEAHLALKERELDLKRFTTIRDGLSLRCKALVECGWVWGEMGKEGLRALEALADPPPAPAFKPLPDPNYTRPSSELSSLAPSQSASQTAGEPAAPKMDIPAAYAINDTTFSPHVLTRRITEEELGGSSEDEEQGDVQVVENPRFSTFKNKSGSDHDLTRRFSIRNDAAQSDIGPISTPRERKTSVSGGRFFGGLRGIFGHKRENSQDEPESPRKSKWKSRTDKNLKVIKKDESDDDEAPQTFNPVAPFIKSPTLTPPPSKRLKKAPTTKKKDKEKEKDKQTEKGKEKEKEKEEPADDRVKRAEAWVQGQSRLSEEEEEDKVMPLARKRSHKSSRVPTTLVVDGTPKRSNSLNVSSETKPVKSQRRAATMSWSGEGEYKQSLMSIVEGVAKQNRDERDRSVGGTIKAPPSKSRKELEEELTHPKTPPPSPPPVPRVSSPKPVVANGPSTAGPSGLHQPVPRAASALPLKSALKTPSRTPSPLPTSPPQPLRPALKRDPSPLRPPTPPASALLKPSPRPKSADMSDAASISSYETGHEAFDEDGEETEHERDPVPNAPKPASSPPLPPIPPHAPVTNGVAAPNGGDSDMSGSTDTATGQPKRRKSVRVSLKPTFSPTPPALEDESEDVYKWNGRAQDVWQDSSDEDEEYSRARSLLARLTKHKH